MGEQPPLALHYAPPARPHLETAAPAPRIAVGRFTDDRDDEAPLVYGRQVEVLGALIPLTEATPLLARQNIAEFATDALASELLASGVAVVEEHQFMWTMPFRHPGRFVRDRRIEGIDRIVVGRVRYFRYTQAGFVGILLQKSMPDARAMIALDVEVVDAQSGRIVWAGSGAAVRGGGGPWAGQEARVFIIRMALEDALAQIIEDPGFRDALSTRSL